MSCRCCGGRCVGCCLPVDYSAPQYPNGVVRDVPFQFVAPNCAELNGRTNTFAPVNPTSASKGICGPCISYLGQNAVVLSGMRVMPLAGRCFPTPCSVSVCLILECVEGETATPGQDTCCSRLRLWVGTNDQQADDIGQRPVATGGLSCTSWKKVAASQCVCGVNTVSARFPFSITFNCTKFTTGPCVGQDDCCKIVCDLTGAEVVI